MRVVVWTVCELVLFGCVGGRCAELVQNAVGLCRFGGGVVY